MAAHAAEPPARLRWAVEVLDPQPADRVLEAGCGPGVAAGLVCARLATGHLLAIDRSATAVARAAQRNREHVEAGRLTVRQCALADLEPERGSVDRAFAVNVNVFWTSGAEREVAVLAAALRPGGTLCLLYDAAAPSGAARALDATQAALAAAGLGQLQTLRSPVGVGVRCRAPGP
ncbi:SAM-dependent methyltransferase [Motilibacter aurantiacus]|uniref:SAM-dependent methyltransferase n=1 Tax=Motilibacter aurantiacus TaxID=2714955 RepID=UPI002F2B3990